MTGAIICLKETKNLITAEENLKVPLTDIAAFSKTKRNNVRIKTHYKNYKDYLTILGKISDGPFQARSEFLV